MARRHHQTRKKAERTALQLDKRRRLKEVLHSFIYQLILWGGWLSLYLNWIPDDGPSSLVRRAILIAPFVLYIAPLVLYAVADRVRDWAWVLVISLWAPCILSLLLGEKSISKYVERYPVSELYTRHNGDTVLVCTKEGLQLLAGFIDIILNAHMSGKSWAGTFSSEHLRLTGNRCRISLAPTFTGSFGNLLLDLSTLGRVLIDHYKFDSQKPEASVKKKKKRPEAYVHQLHATLTDPPVSANSSPIDMKKFIKFLGKHLARKSSREKKLLFRDLFQILKALGAVEKASLDATVAKINITLKDWRTLADKDPLLRETLYYHQFKPNNTVCRYGPGPDELFRFLRNFLEHGGDRHANGQQKIGSMKDIDTAGAELFPPFTVKLTYHLVMVLEMAGLLDYAWENN
ncbi:uncharacterized protein [Aegilops tauschii subsp. strangulata]|uniref:Uncharacterized protein n=3 Tax=Aegilops tauschii subsp. strangulata TaxID=200361 RepID=A0A453DWJ4_AEGTS|nr:uncharacterized protein LOC120976390 [Aegilops tauschii subsp. strangulata]XP_040259244.1 uncharacterized protein LOC120976390 [Aegilops tauschii subsp. strangulata]XP_040259245.1 uncharacterized protein LOC120976390 [Aegilops tauschii subsp. strangulata]